jgi:hypothetical protein
LSGLFFAIILTAYIIFKALKLTSTDHDQ